MESKIESTVNYVSSRLEDKDQFLYKIVDAKYTIDIDLKNKRAEYNNDILIEKIVKDEIVWFTRFDKDAKAEFIGAYIVNHVTNHSCKKNGSDALDEISLVIPKSDVDNEQVRFNIRYKRNFHTETVSDIGKSKRILIGLFNSFASYCEQYTKEIKLNNGKVNIISILSPAEKNKDNNKITIYKSNLSPKQFLPVTILIDEGNYKFNKILNKLLWSVISAVIGFILGLLA